MRAMALPPCRRLCGLRTVRASKFLSRAASVAFTVVRCTNVGNGNSQAEADAIRRTVASLSLLRACAPMDCTASMGSMPNAASMHGIAGIDARIDGVPAS
jgi:hypothetical protein